MIIVWDAATKTQHFIRKASFKSDADDFGFLVPTPNQPELEESGNEAFPYLQKLTEPEIQTRRASGGPSCGCGEETKKSAAPPMAVRVLAEKEVAGFRAVVLEASSASELVNWLRANGYTMSPEVEAWARPYVDQKWKFTALKVAKDENGKASKSLTAAALRISFKTDRPLFPYREPDPQQFAKALGARQRLLRIYFLADGRIEAGLTRELPWTGKAVWANRLRPEDRKRVLELLRLPDTAAPDDCWLTEFEDNWPYRPAPADVYFARDTRQDSLKRPPLVRYVSATYPTDIMSFAIVGVVVGPPLLRWWRGRRDPRAS